MTLHKTSNKLDAAKWVGVCMFVCTVLANFWLLTVAQGELATLVRGVSAPQESIPMFHVHIIHLANAQLLRLASVTFSLSLASIGFILFLIGADGAFSADISSENKGRVVLAASAPGLACFLFASIIVVATVMRSSSFDTAQGVASTLDGLAGDEQMEETVRQLRELRSSHQVNSSGGE